MFRRTASITIASIASVGLLAAVALGASLTLDNAPKAQLEDIQVFPESDEPRIATPHVEPEQQAPPLTLPLSAETIPTPDSIAKQPAPKSPAVILPPATEPAQAEPAQPEAAPTTQAPPTTETEPEQPTTVPEAPEILPPAPVKPEQAQPDPIEVVLPPVVENPAVPDVPDDKPEAPVEPKRSKPGKDNKKHNDRDRWEEIVDDWKDKIDKGDWDVEIDWDNGEWKIDRDDDDDDDDD